MMWNPWIALILALAFACLLQVRLSRRLRKHVNIEANAEELPPEPEQPPSGP